MKNVIIFILVAVSSLSILGYSVHMFIGGLVSEQTETWAIIIAVSIGVVVLAFMGYDIAKQHRR